MAAKKPREKGAGKHGVSVEKVFVDKTEDTEIAILEPEVNEEGRTQLHARPATSQEKKEILAKEN